jgi:hypothetical protein
MEYYLEPLRSPQMFVTFFNHGEIDPRLITTLGVNVKESSNPIGFFGTGLKYAIAVLLREGQNLTIWSGLRELRFSLERDTLRGKEFDFIVMKETGKEKVTLGFTSELGKNWSLANAYRELYCNAKDEGGDVSGNMLDPNPGTTTIIVEGDAFYKTHQARNTFLLLERGSPLFSTEELEVYSGKSENIFYRGIAAMKITTPSNFTINIKEYMDLTEDRTIKYPYFANLRVARAFAEKCYSKEILKEILLSDCFERSQIVDGEWNETLLDVMEELIVAEPLSLPEPIRDRFYRSRKREIPRKEILGEPIIERALKNAIATLTLAGFPVSKYAIKVCEELGRNILGIADRQTRTIFLSRKTFEHASVEETLLEEFIHLEYGVADNSREMQDVLLRHIVRLSGKVGVSFEKKASFRRSSRITPPRELPF